MRHLIQLLALAFALGLPYLAAAESPQVSEKDPIRGLPAISGDGNSVLLPYARPGNSCDGQLVIHRDLLGRRQLQAPAFLVGPCNKTTTGARRQAIAALNKLLRAGRYKSLTSAKRRGKSIRVPGLQLTVRREGTRLEWDIAHKGKPAKAYRMGVFGNRRASITGATYVSGPVPHVLVGIRLRVHQPGKPGTAVTNWMPSHLAPYPPPPKLSAAGEAKRLFRDSCSTCHGLRGKGDGEAARVLYPKPRDYTDVAWQKTVTDEYLAKVIVGGGMSVGKSPLMPPYPMLQRRPAVVKALVRLVRRFGRATTP